MTLKGQFRQKYVYREATATPNNLSGKGIFNIAVFGLHEKAGSKLFEKFLPGETIPTPGDGDFLVKQLLDGTEKVQIKAIVNRSQYAVESFFTAAVGALQCYDDPNEGIRSIVLVFDANFVRFSSDVKRAMALMQEMFGPNVWDHTALIIINSDDVLGEGTIDDYLHKTGNADLRHYADKLGGGVMALPSYPDDYDVEFQKNQLLNVIKKTKDPYQMTTSTAFRFMRYRMWIRLYALFGWTL